MLKLVLCCWQQLRQMRSKRAARTFTNFNIGIGNFLNTSVLVRRNNAVLFSEQSILEISHSFGFTLHLYLVGTYVIMAKLAKRSHSHSVKPQPTQKFIISTSPGLRQNITLVSSVIQAKKCPKLRYL